jgi:hypothetical protein
MGHRTHVTILFHNQSLLVIRIFHRCKLYINQISGFQRLPTYRAVHCLVLNGREQNGTRLQSSQGSIPVLYWILNHGPGSYFKDSDVKYGWHSLKAWGCKGPSLKYNTQSILP